jgi:hypothetical protein
MSGIAVYIRRFRRRESPLRFSFARKDPNEACGKQNLAPGYDDTCGPTLSFRLLKQLPAMAVDTACGKIA